MIDKDINTWVLITNINKKGLSNSRYLHLLLLKKQEFRNLFYKRINNNIVSTILNVLYPKLDSLNIATKDIGSGLFISHGFSSIILADSIGENCWINQQVTIGTKNSVPKPPTICNNVRIGAGSIVIGDIRIGNNTFIGAGAVVTKNVPDNCVVVGNPAYIIKKNGVRVKEKL